MWMKAGRWQRRWVGGLERGRRVDSFGGGKEKIL